ncbi:MAG: hypothetical protein QNJ62_09320, partial [Methyloceanibacter sp.]|nr:hypothetical protein [Methyloceanibacter sp.]
KVREKLLEHYLLPAVSAAFFTISGVIIVANSRYGMELISKSHEQSLGYFKQLFEILNGPLE